MVSACNVRIGRGKSLTQKKKKKVGETYFRQITITKKKLNKMLQ